MLLTLLVCGPSCGVLSRAKVPDHVRLAATCKANVPVGIEPLCLTKKVMLLHFSKCSGTTICNLAQQAGCETWKRPRQLRDLTPPTPVGVNCGRHLQQLPNPTLTLTLP